MENSISIEIPYSELQQVEKLFTQYNAYVDILSLLMKRNVPEDNPLFDKKWTETALIYKDLEDIKSIMDKKYHPEGQWTHYVFDFNNCKMVYYAGE